MVYSCEAIGFTRQNYGPSLSRYWFMLMLVVYISGVVSAQPDVTTSEPSDHNEPSGSCGLLDIQVEQLLRQMTYHDGLLYVVSSLEYSLDLSFMPWYLPAVSWDHCVGGLHLTTVATFQSWGVTTIYFISLNELLKDDVEPEIETAIEVRDFFLGSGILFKAWRSGRQWARQLEDLLPVIDRIGERNYSGVDHWHEIDLPAPLPPPNVIDWRERRYGIGDIQCGIVSEIAADLGSLDFERGGYNDEQSTFSMSLASYYEVCELSIVSSSTYSALTDIDWREDPVWRKEYQCSVIKRVIQQFGAFQLERRFEGNRGYVSVEEGFAERFPICNGERSKYDELFHFLAVLSSYRPHKLPDEQLFHNNECAIDVAEEPFGIGEFLTIALDVSRHNSWIDLRLKKIVAESMSAEWVFADDSEISLPNGTRLRAIQSKEDFRSGWELYAVTINVGTDSYRFGWMPISRHNLLMIYCEN